MGRSFGGGPLFSTSPWYPSTIRTHASTTVFETFEHEDIVELQTRRLALCHSLRRHAVIRGTRNPVSVIRTGARDTDRRLFAGLPRPRALSGRSSHATERLEDRANALIGFAN